MEPLLATPCPESLFRKTTATLGLQFGLSAYACYVNLTQSQPEPGEPLLLLLSLMAFPCLVIALTRDLPHLASFLLFTLLTLAQALIASYPKNEIGDRFAFLILYLSSGQVLSLAVCSACLEMDRLWPAAEIVSVVLALPLGSWLGWTVMPLVGAWCLVASRLWRKRLELAC